MSDTTFRQQSTELPAQPIPYERRGDDSTTLTESPVFEPLERGRGAILEAMGIKDELSNLPEGDKSNHDEVEAYLFDLLDKKGISPSLPNIKREFDSLKSEMGLDEHAEPSMVLDRIGGVIKAWKSLSFINDPNDKKQIFFRLANAKSSKDMNRIVFEEMERRSVWQ